MLDQNKTRALRNMLETRDTELREEIRQELLQSDQQHFIDLAGQVHDLQEESVADLLVDLDLAFIDMHIQEVREIDAARIRLATGAYGNCDGCGQEIAFERLQANPVARRCTPCQARYEREHAGPAHPTL